MLSKLKEFFLINLGVVMVALGMYFFLMPNNLATGGANGLAIVINKFNENISVGTIMLIINLILFILAFLIIGKAFGAKTIYSSFAVSFVIFILERVLPMKSSLTGEIFLELVFGILISGIGMGIVFNQNASTGGTDIIAKILNKFFHIDLGKGVLMSDLFITVLAAFAFGLKLSMYAMLGVIINGFVIDAIIEGLNMCKEVNIISKKNDDIKKYIREDLGKTSTSYNAIGDYTEGKREIIVVVISRRDFIKLKNYITKIDKEAFITVRNTCEVFGNGFKSLTL